MFWTRASESTRTLVYSVAVVAITAMALFYLASFNSPEVVSAAPAAVTTSTFAANPASLGAIPDATTSGCGVDPSGSRDVTFNVSGVTGTVNAVAVNFNASHTWVNDLRVTLLAPAGTPSHLLFARTFAVSPTDCASLTGGANNLISSNTYGFDDTAATSWWTRAATDPIPGGLNRTQAAGVDPSIPPVTSLNTTFGGMTAGAANGTWTLRFEDQGGGDTGTVTAAVLSISTSAAVSPAQHVVDFDGDGKTDFSIVRNTGGGSGGQVTWMNNNSTTGISGFAWGISTDFYVPCDYDGDGKTDVAVWRPGAPGGSNFYILQSQTSTLRIDTFGQDGDDPTVVRDYDGDGKCDPAVYRVGTNPGDQSFWFYRGSMNPANITYVPWGINSGVASGDFPAPGDYDGDGKADFVVQRDNGGGQARFWELFANGTTNINVIFGTPTDVIVPGDYDGDGKTDIATVRGVNGQIQWQWLASSTGTINYGVWGLAASDYLVQGDYDGDGKTDLAIWRPDADPSQNFFYVRKSSNGSLLVSEWGMSGDYPTANFNVH